MKTARRKGHDFERAICHDWQEIGFPDATTTRAARGGDWSHSDDGTDLKGTGPFSVQCKRLQGYASVNTIEEIKRAGRPVLKPSAETVLGVPRSYEVLEQIPLLLTKANNKETMAVLPWSELKKLIKAVYND